MKSIVLAVFISLSCFSFGEEVHTREQSIQKMRDLLVNKLKATPSQIEKIKKDNAARFQQMDAFYSEIGQLKSAILDEVFSRYPSDAKLEKLYGKFHDLEQKRLKVWVAMTKSIWSTLQIDTESHAKNQEYNKVQLSDILDHQGR